MQLIYFNFMLVKFYPKFWSPLDSILYYYTDMTHAIEEQFSAL
jgi:hypothetical protein